MHGAPEHGIFCPRFILAPAATPASATIGDPNHARFHTVNRTIASFHRGSDTIQRHLYCTSGHRADSRKRRSYMEKSRKTRVAQHRFKLDAARYEVVDLIVHRLHHDLILPACTRSGRIEDCNLALHADAGIYVWRLDRRCGDDSEVVKVGVMIGLQCVVFASRKACEKPVKHAPVFCSPNGGLVVCAAATSESAATRNPYNVTESTFRLLSLLLRNTRFRCLAMCQWPWRRRVILTSLFAAKLSMLQSANLFCHKFYCM